MPFMVKVKSLIGHHFHTGCLITDSFAKLPQTISIHLISNPQSAVGDGSPLAHLAGNTFDCTEFGRTHLHTPTTLDALGLIDFMDLPFGTNNGTNRTAL
jgi:hypothetical protein